MLSARDKEWTFRALTDIWTGDANGKPGRLITVGLLGSLRWWFEVLVRGLDGSACDPSGEGGRPCPNFDIKDPTEPGHHCVVCELFGCTGWARKFRFDVLAAGSGEVQKDQITRDGCFTMRFTPLRPISVEEWSLIGLTLHLISEYGAVGGKTVYKPSDQEDRKNKTQHRDYGLVQLTDAPVVSMSRDHLEEYVRSAKWRKVDDSEFRWAALDNFWFVKGRYLARDDDQKSTFNKVVGRTERKQTAKYLADTSAATQWLAGSQQISKKVFSFRGSSLTPSYQPRTYGFVKPGLIDFSAMLGRLQTVWPDLKESDFIKGEDILSVLFQAEVKPDER